MVTNSNLGPGAQATILPDPGSYADWKQWANALKSKLEVANMQTNGTAMGGVPGRLPPNYVNRDGNPLISPEGLWIYAPDGTLPISPDIVQIDTQHLVDLAVNGDKLAEGAVDTIHVRDAAITSALIGDLAVVSAKIDNLAVNNAKIANGAISSAKIQDAAITNAKIDNLAVGSAQIQNLAVDTIKVNSGAITNVAAASVIGTAIIPGSYDAVAQVSLTLEGFQVAVWATCHMERFGPNSNPTINYRLRASGYGVLHQGSLTFAGNPFGSAYESIAPNHSIAILPAGPTTFYLEIFNSDAGSVNIRRFFSSIFVLENKR